MEETPTRRIISYEVEAAETVAGLLTRDFRSSTLSGALCLVSLARAVQMTPYQVTRCFQRRFGMSIEAYVNRLRWHPAWGRQWVMLAI
jgi:AraC-like DNA-binding protein